MRTIKKIISHVLTCLEKKDSKNLMINITISTAIISTLSSVLKIKTNTSYIEKGMLNATGIPKRIMLTTLSL